MSVVSEQLLRQLCSKLQYEVKLLALVSSKLPGSHTSIEMVVGGLTKLKVQDEDEPLAQPPLLPCTGVQLLSFCLVVWESCSEFSLFLP